MNKWADYDLNDYGNDASKFAIYPDANTGSNQEFSYLSLGLGGETGEVLEKVKKKIRDGRFDKQEVAKELGDVLWYLSRLSNACGYCLSEIASMNIEKLSSRKERNVLNGNGDNR